LGGFEATLGPGVEAMQGPADSGNGTMFSGSDTAASRSGMSRPSETYRDVGQNRRVR
jgi:hypothetical protein